MPDQPKNILAVCHDAGAAEIISAYVKVNPNHDRWFCLALGPAQKVFLRKGLNDLLVVEPERVPSEVIASLGSLDLVLTGTSWSTSLDRDYLIAAKNAGIRTAAYLDHWINYRERFGYPTPGWEQNLPDEVWVGDEYALSMAQSLECFPNVKLVPNVYFDEMKADIELVRQTVAQTPNIPRKKRVLFISEPVSVGATRSHGDPRYFGYTEIEVVRDIITVLTEENPTNLELCIRLHPADPPGHYDEVFRMASARLSVSYSNTPNLIEDILCADVIIGMDSMALVTAVFAGKPVFSYIPSEKKACCLPFREIRIVKSPRILRASIAPLLFSI